MQNTEEGKGKENRMSEHWDDQIELDQDIDFLKLPMKRIDTNCRVFPLISKTESTNKCAKYWIYSGLIVKPQNKPEKSQTAPLKIQRRGVLFTI